MSDQLGIPAGAVRAVWVFAVDLPPEDLTAFREHVSAEKGDLFDWPFRDALGLRDLDLTQIELFEAETLSDYTLSRYLIDANGMDADSVAPDAETLDALTGPVLLVFSGALSDRETRLDPQPPFRLIGRYAEHLSFSTRLPLTSDGAKGLVAPNPKKKTSDAALSGRIATLALLVLFGLVGLMIWIGG